MGYYTDYKLEFDTELDEETLVGQLEEITPYTWYGGLELSDVKWYDYRDHMKIISKKYPETLFKLYGNGEESEDIWVEYFKNGKSRYERGMITFAEFDETKLEK